MGEFKTYDAIRRALSSGETTVNEVVKTYLNRIDAHRDLNAFLEVYGDEALTRAEEVQAKIQKGKAGKLAGMVIGIKDNIVYRDHRVSASSKMLEGFESLFSATVVERLLAEDAIIIGRLNCDEFAMGSANEYSAFGAVRNPHNKDYVPGGSSGGSAAAVAAGLCTVSLGSDTGGSIRQPASFTGTIGFKPTYGRVSRNGLIAFASSFDQIGPFAHSTSDIQLVMEVIGGSDPMDTTSLESENPKYTAEKPKEKYRIAYFKECIDNESLDSEIREKTHALIEELKRKGHTVEPVDFPMLDYLVPTYYVLTTAEASSNLARYDGIHYGYRSPNAVDLESSYKLSRSEGFGEEVKRRIMLGTFVLSSGYYDAFYGKGQKVRRMLVEKTREITDEYDFILSPTTPHTAFKIGREITDPTVMYLEDIFTVHANLCGLPSVSLPLGTHSNGLPFGMQLTAAEEKDAELLAFSGALMNE